MSVVKQNKFEANLMTICKNIDVFVRKIYPAKYFISCKLSCILERIQRLEPVFNSGLPKVKMAIFRRSRHGSEGIIKKLW